MSRRFNNSKSLKIKEEEKEDNNDDLENNSDDLENNEEVFEKDKVKEKKIFKKKLIPYNLLMTSTQLNFWQRPEIKNVFAELVRGSTNTHLSNEELESIVESLKNIILSQRQSLFESFKLREEKRKKNKD